MMMMPTGFRFNPTDEELLELLYIKVSGQDMHFHGRFILHTDVYHLDPKHLQWDHNVALSHNERYYCYLRKDDSREVAGQGWWRAAGHVKKIYANYKDQLLVGVKRPLTFHRFKDHQYTERRRKKAIKTNWIMHEYTLESYSTEWRLCKIRYKGKPSVQEELENLTKASSSTQHPEFMAEEQQQQPQTLQLHNFSHYSGEGNQNNGQCSYQQDNMYENEAYTFAELAVQNQINVEQQQQISFHDQIEQFVDSSEQVFPCNWSWQRDLDI